MMADGATKWPDRVTKAKPVKNKPYSKIAQTNHEWVHVFSNGGFLATKKTAYAPRGMSNNSFHIRKRSKCPKLLPAHVLKTAWKGTSTKIAIIT